MTGSLPSIAIAWLLTYAIHSTVLLSLAWLVIRLRRWTPAAAELLWKSALLGGIFTATIQLQLDVRPAGTISLQRTADSPVVPTAARAKDVPERRPLTLTEQPPAAPAPSDAATEAAPHAAPRTTRQSAEALVVGLWATIALVLALSYAARRMILVGRLGDRAAVPDGRLLDMLDELSRGAGLRTAPRLTTTTRISSPIALGLQEICVPDTALTQLDLEQQRSMLAHELAHLARRDPVWMGLASLVERVLWIQPLNRVARRQIARSAEFLCDDWAVRRTGSGIALARCLAQVAEWVQASPLGVPVAGMAEERSLLVSRVARLLEGGTPAARSRRGLAVASAAVLVATIVVAPGVSSRSARTLLAGEANTLRTYEPSVKEPARDNSSAVGASVPTSSQIAVPEVAGPHQPRLTSADSSVVLALIARLKDEDAEVRKAAAHSLGRLGDARAVPGLIGALKDPEPKVRATAAEALGEFEDARAIDPLSALLADSSTEVKQSALDALSHFDQGVSSAGVVRLLTDSDAEIRHRAAQLAGKLHDRSASPALARLVRDSNADVRQAALEALGELKDLSAVPAILSALSDANADVRHQALNTLEELRAPIPDPTLIGLMKDGSPDVRAKAAELAGERSVIAAIPAIRRLLEDGNADVRGNAVSALGNIADAGAYDALRGALTSKDAKVRRAAAEALGDRRP
jgi:HEAT repeat protein/beta-lactamase regulating signal transducer with metallopeptidase domain